MSLDKVIVEVIITIDGKQYLYKNLSIEANGILWSTPVDGNAVITIYGIEKSIREEILKLSLPQSDITKKPFVELKVGRESYGAERIFIGRCFTANQTYLPNLGVILNCITGYDYRFQNITKESDKITKLSDIAKWAADDNGLILSFEAKEQNVQSFNYSGTISGEIRNLSNLFPDLSIYSDGSILYVLDKNSPPKNSEEIIVDASTGLIRITPTMSGIDCDVLFNQKIRMSSQILANSKTNPALNGRYMVYLINFSISSRSQNFFQKISARKLK